MVIKVQREAKSCVKHLFTAVNQSWEVCLPFRQSLLMSWCNSSERESERAKHNNRLLSPLRGWDSLSAAVRLQGRPKAGR